MGIWNKERENKRGKKRKRVRERKRRDKIRKKEKERKKKRVNKKEGKREIVKISRVVFMLSNKSITNSTHSVHSTGQLTKF